MAVVILSKASYVYLFRRKMYQQYKSHRLLQSQTIHLATLVSLEWFS